MMRCFACGRKCSNPCRVQTPDEQIVKVGIDCWQRVKAAGPDGYPIAGTRLFLMTEAVRRRWIESEQRMWEESR